MAKLTKSVAKEAREAASTGSRDPLDPGLYPVKLTKLEVKEGAAGPYWACELTIPKGHENAGRKLWTNVSLSPKARFKVSEFFTAFGNPECTAETDDLFGITATAVVGQETQSQGAGMGQLRNTVVRLQPETEEDDYELDDSDDDEDDL